MTTKNNEQIIVTLTTWSKRLCNIPVVLSSIYNQTVLPDFVVINLANDEVLPENVSDYLDEHKVIINRVEDTKVYKKLWPTLNMFPDACVINIDDDFYYPSGMIADFMESHRKFPHSPISGNRCCEKFVKCHCGCASLTKKEFFGKYFTLLDEEVISHCPSDDMVYTYLIQKNGLSYRQTSGEYFDNMTPVNPVEQYSRVDDGAIDKTWSYLIERFGNIRGYNGFLILLKKSINKLKVISGI